MSKITVIGSFVADMVARVERFPMEAETILGKSLNIYPGGKGANQCVAIKRLGGDVEMCGVVGEDGNGDMFKKVFASELIKRDKIFTVENVATGCAQIQIDQKSQNKIVVIPGANHAFSTNMLEQLDETIKNTEIIVFQLEMTLDVTFEAIRRAKKYGKIVVLNPAPAVKLPSDILSLVDYLTPNEVELGIIAEEDTSSLDGIKTAAKKLVQMGVKNIVATLGGTGSLIANKEMIDIVPSYKVKVVDTVAAGDSFNGAMVVKLSEGASLKEAVQFANAMGALTVTKEGAIPSLHTRAEVEEFMKINS